MKRWEQFNQIFHRDDSLDVQVAETFCERIKEEEQRGNAVSNKNELYTAVRKWLLEEV